MPNEKGPDMCRIVDKLLRYAEYKTNKSGPELCELLGIKHHQQYYRLKKKHSRDLQLLVNLNKRLGISWDELTRVLDEEYSPTR